MHAMKHLQYLVELEKDRGSDWGASVPDLPGCVACAKTADSALRRIAHAIELHLRDMRNDGVEPPRARRRAVKSDRAEAWLTLWAVVDVDA